MNRTNMLLIQTPEGIEFPLILAGPVSRFLAWLLDALCVFAMCSVIGMVLGMMASIAADLAIALVVIAYFLISIGYPIVMEWFWRGQTIGKRLLGLRVMDAQGLKLHFSQIAIRNLLRFVDALPLFYVVGGVASLVNRHAQRLGDVAANTIVVRIPRISEPDLTQVLSGKYNSFRDFPHLAARLRQRVSPKEAAIALQALIRRDELNSTARIELFQEIVDHLKQIVEFPVEVTEGITEEQYVRNVVDILFQKSVV
ncbi:MAG: RDD family protein [Acidobacteria bacterium]|nr:MAG: RDD family protein [Acidobacteriota bacterium]